MAKGFNVPKGGGKSSKGFFFNVPKTVLAASKPSLSVKNTLTLVQRSPGKMGPLVRPLKLKPDDVESSTPMDNGTIYAAYGTDFEDLLLPDGIVWEEGDYNPLVEGDYELTGSGNNVITVVLEKFALKLEPANLYTLAQESPAQTSITPVTADGQNVGIIIDLGKGHPVTCASSTRPTLTSHANFSTFITQGAAVQSFFLNSVNYLRFHQDTSPVYSIQFIWKFETGSDGVLKRMFFTSSLSGTTLSDAGLMVRKTAGNKLQVVCRKKVNGQVVFDHTTTTDFNVAAGVIRCTVNIDGTGTNTGVIHIKNDNGVDTSETFNIGTGNNVTPDRTNMPFLSDTFQSMGALRVRDRICTPTEISDWKTYNPARHSTAFLIKHRDIDFRDTNYVFSDAAGTTPVTEGGNIRFADNRVVSPWGVYGQATSAADATAPAWRNNSGASYAEYASGDDLVYEGQLTAEGGGKYTVFIVASNNDATDGSHILSGASGSNVYMVQTGASYPDGPYMVIHPNSGFTTAIGTIPANAGTNIYAFIRDMEACTLINKAGTIVTDSDEHMWVIQGSGISGNSSSTWNLDGRLYRVIKYSGVLSSARVNEIMAELLAAYP